MFVIRNAQKEALGAAMRTAFEEKMVLHLQKCFPEWSAGIRPKELLEFIRFGIKRANRYGFRTELEITRYLHAMQALGQDFDESRDFPWTAELLIRKIPVTEKMDRLRDAVEYEVEARRIRNAR